MHTLNSYQHAATELSDRQSADKELLNLMSAVGLAAAAYANAETWPLNVDGDNRDNMRAALGACLFNVTMLAQRFGYGLEGVADAQLRALESAATATGRLRAQRGER